MDLKNYQKRFMQSYQLRTDNGGNFIARHDGETVYLYDARDYREITTFRDTEYVSQIRFSADGKYLAAKSIEPELAVYDLKKLELASLVDFEDTVAAQDGKFCFSPDNKYIYNIVSFEDGSSAIARIDIKRQTYQLIFQFENCRFEDAEYLPWRDVYLFGGIDQTSQKYFVLEYGVKNDKFRRVMLDREYGFSFPCRRSRPLFRWRRIKYTYWRPTISRRSKFLPRSTTGRPILTFSTSFLNPRHCMIYSPPTRRNMTG